MRRAAFVLLFVLAGAAAGCGKGPPQLAPPEPPTVAVVKPREKPQRIVKEFTGRLVTKDPVKVVPQVSGRVVSREFQDDKLVEKDKTVLYRIDSVLFKADVDKAKADIAKATADVANWTAQGARDRAEFARLKKQLDDGATNLTEVEKAQANVKVDEAQVEVARANKAAAESALMKAEENLRYCTIYAPTTGIAGRSLVAPNALVDAYKSELVTVYPVNELYAEWEVDEQTSLWYRDKIRTGALGDPRHPESQIECVIKLKNEKQFSDDKGDRSRHSFVDAIDPEIARGTGTRTLRATFQNTPQKGSDGETRRPLLSAGDSVRVRLISGDPRPVLTVPETVIFTQQRKQYVYVVADGKAQLREVEVGATLDGDTEVNRRASATATTGLDERDAVIADNLLRVRPGIPVTVK